MRTPALRCLHLAFACARRPTRRKHWAVALSVAVACSAPSSTDDPRLVLTEVRSVPLAAEFNFSGLVLDEDHRVIAWARHPNVVLRLGEGLQPVDRWTLPDSLVPIAVWADGPVLEVVTGEPSGVHRLAGEGAQWISDYHDSSETILGATRGSDGWILLTEEVLTGTLVVRVGEQVLPIDTYSGITVGWDGVMWTTQTKYPFEAKALGPRVGDRGPMRPDQEVLSAMSGGVDDDLSQWASLPVVPVGHGFLQTLADWNGDRRVLVVYDSMGTVQSVLVIDVPVGFVASTPTRRVYGARRTDVLEIVEYEYEWVQQPQIRQSAEGGP